MAPTKSAGRVSIRVLPDSTRFRQDLQKTLDRIENSMKVNIRINPVLDKQALAELKRQIEQLAIKIRPDIDLNVPSSEIQKIKQKIEAMKPMVSVNVKANTAATAARISALTRDKMVHIWPILHNTAVKNFTKHLAAISGASFISKEIQKGMDFLRTIDQHAIQLAKQATLVGGVISLALGAVQAVVALGDGLIKTLGILTLVPALLSSFSIAMAVFSVVLKDMKDVLADLGPAFTTLADEMSFAFWDEAADPIREMVNHLMPTLSEKMILASTSMGKLTGQIAKSYKEHVTIEKFATMFDRVLESMDTVRGAVDPIIEAFTILGMHGTKYLNRLSESIVKMTEKFRDWLKVNEENGNLTKWTEDAIEAFKDLGGIVKGVWDIFGALNTAIKNAGGPTLDTLRQNLQNLAAMMESPQFQQSLTGVLRGVNSALGDIGQGVIDLGPALATMAPTIELAFVSVGETIKILLGYLGDIMSHPAVRGGLLDFFHGIKGAVEGLAPAIEPFSVALGSMLKLLGTVVENVGILVGTILSEWGPALQRLSDEFDTIAQPLREMLETVVRELTPALETLVDKGIIPLLGWIRDDLIPAVSDLVESLGPGLKTTAEILGWAIQDVLIPALKLITDLFKDADGTGSDFQKTLDGIDAFFANPLVWTLDFTIEAPKNIWDSAMEDAKKALTGEKKPLGDAFGEWLLDLNEDIGKMLWDWGAGIGKKIADMWNNVDWAPNMEGKNNLWDGIKEKWDDLGNMWDNFWENLGNNNKDWSQKMDEEGFELATAGIDINLTELGTRFSEWWATTSEGWSGFWGGFGETAAIKWEEFTAGIGEWWAGLTEGFTTWWTDLGVGWNEFWAGFGETAALKYEEFKTAISEWWLGVSEGFATWWEGIKTGWSEFWAGFSEKFEEAKTGISEGFSEWWEGVTTGFDEWWQGITEGWNEFWAGFGEKFTEAKDGIKTGFDEWWAGITEGFNKWWEDVKTGWNDFWSGVKQSTSTWWSDIKTTISTKTQEIKQNLSTWIEDQKTKIRDGWQNVRNDTATKWEEIKQAVAQKWEQMIGYIPGALGRFVSWVRNGFESARQTAQQKMEELRQAVATKIDEVVQWVQTLPQRMINAIQGTSLYQSGVSLMTGFLNGIRGMANTIVETVRGIMQRARDLFPFSPAKTGPFSGRGYTTHSGAALMDGFSQGMESRMASTVNTAKRMAKGVAQSLNSISSDPDLGEHLEARGGGNVSLKVYNPIAEPTSRTIARASSMIKLGGKP